MLFHWEGIDDWRPPNLKHVPASEVADLNKARAQRHNNALLALSYRHKTISPRNRQARNHRLFHCGKFPQIPASIFSRKSRGKRVSRIETLPANALVKIFRLVPWYDLAALALTSTSMMQRVCTHRPRNKTDSNELPVFQHVALMSRLENWMPTKLKFCHHCFIYLPRHNFGPTDGDQDMMQCMDCKYFSTTGLKNEHHRLSPLPCEGCFYIRWIEELYQEDPDEWGHLSDLKGPLYGDPLDLSEDYNESMELITDPSVRMQVRNICSIFPTAGVWECYMALLENDGNYLEALDHVGTRLLGPL